LGYQTPQTNWVTEVFSVICMYIKQTQKLMKKFIFIASTILTTILGSHTMAQRHLPPDLIGANLKEVQEQYRREINRGADSLLVPYAEALFYDGKLREALKMFQKADSIGLEKTLGQQRNYSFVARRLGARSPYDVQTGYFAGYWDIEAEIKTFAANSTNEDFAPFLWQDMLFITSSRTETRTRRRNTYALTQMPFLNIHAFTLDGQPVNPDFLPDGMNTPLHDGPLAIAADTSLVVVTRNYDKPNQDGVHTLYLSYYTREGRQWSEEKSFPVNDPAYFVQHPYFDNTTNTLYFSSNMPGGFGGFDLYKSVWNGRQWSNPANLGQEVNSPYDEVFPSLSPGGELIYATNHIETTGGLDLVIFKQGQRYLFPRPFNTPHDDFAITFLDEQSGYFSTNRDYEAFGDNIYHFHIIPPPEYPFIVRVLDKESKDPIPEVSVAYEAMLPALKDIRQTSAAGETTIHHGPEEPFSVGFRVTHEDYYPLEITADNFRFEEEQWLLELELEPLPQIIRDGFFVVYFDNDRPDPRSISPTTGLSYEETFEQYMERKNDYLQRSENTPGQVQQFFDVVQQGMEQLKQLAAFLKQELEQGRHYTIEFTSHASPLATSQYNMILSKRRFVSVENFLRSWQGGVLETYIEQGMLTYENNPFGSTQAPRDVSADRQNLSSSVYGVAAATERRVTISWRTNDEVRTRDAVPRHAPQTTNETRIADPETAADPETDTVRDYHIIVASFINHRDAEDKAVRLREQYHTNATVLPRAPNGWYRVSYNNYPSIQKAKTALQKIKRDIRADAWILPM